MARHISTIPRLITAGILAIAAAGCASSGGTPGATAASAPSSAAASTAVTCAPASGQGQVAVSIKDFAFGPATITAKVGQTITFTNQDTTDHTATVGGTCTTGHITPGSAAGLTFSAPGTYDFACAIHPSMTGTITIS